MYVGDPPKTAAATGPANGKNEKRTTVQTLHDEKIGREETAADEHS